MEYDPSATTPSAFYFSDRLLSRLAVLTEKPLTVVEAPLGFGKTVAVREFLRRNQIPSVWVPVIGGDPEVYWRDFCRAILRSRPECLDTVSALWRLGYPVDSVYTEAARELLLDIDFAPGTVLVVDDYHLLPDSDSDGETGIGGLFRLLARQASGRLHTVIITRDAYSGGRELLSLKGGLTVVNRNDLALTWQEILEYYQQNGVELTPDEARRLHADTSGWISALYLSLLHRRKYGRFAPAAAIAGLVEEEVYSPLSSAAKELLLALYPLERFTTRQAGFLHRKPDVQELLDGLRRKNSFLAYEEEDDSYALHSLVRQCLATRFERLPPERRQAIHRRCAEWFAAEGETWQAIAAYREAEDVERALMVLKSGLARHSYVERADYLIDLIKSCPAEMLERHVPVVFKCALVAICTGDFQTFDEQRAWLELHCPALARNEREAEIWQGGLEILRSFAVYNDIAAMSEHHRRAYAFLKRPTQLFSPNSPWTLGSPSVMFLYHRESGRLTEEVRQMRECLPHYHILAPGHGAGAEHAMEAEARYHAGDFPGASLAASRAYASAEAWNQIGVMLCVMFVRLRLSLAEGNYLAAAGLVKDMRKLVLEGRDYFLLHTVDLCEGYLHAAVGRVDGIPEWIRFGSGIGKRLYSCSGGWYTLVRGRALLLDDRPAETIGLFSWLLESGTFSKHAIFTIYAHLYIAAAHAAMRRPADAAGALAKALEFALPDGILMPFAENWEHLESVEPAMSATDAAGLARIKPLAAMWGKRRRGIVARHFATERPLLTRRELELARLAAAGKKYKEIADELRLAPTTVKKAFVTIYGKLGISSREELREHLERYK